MTIRTHIAVPLGNTLRLRRRQRPSPDRPLTMLDPLERRVLLTSAITDALRSGVQTGNPAFAVSAGITPLIFAAAAPSVTTTTLKSSGTKGVFGQSVVLTATVAAKGASAARTGTVTFKDGASVVGIAPVGTASTATLTIPLASTGTHSFTAAYSGDPAFAVSTSSTLKVTVNKDAVLATLTLPAGTFVPGQAVNLSAAVGVVAPGAGTPTGIVTFKDAGKSIGTVTLDGTGHATLPVTFAKAGKHTLTVSYGGDNHDNAATSKPKVETLGKAGTTVDLHDATAAVGFGHTATFTATVAPVAPGNAPPRGKVQFSDGGKVVATIPVVNGHAVWSTTTLLFGTHTITAKYLGDTNTLVSNSPGVTETIQAVAGALQHDTGPSSTDHITNNAAVSGSIFGGKKITKVLAGFDAAATASYFNLTPNIQSNGTFILNASLEQAINGSPLADGTHTLHLKAFDAKGVALGTVDLPITLDTIAPAQPVFDLDPSLISDAAVAAGTTTFRVASLVGYTDPGATVSLANGTAAVADSTGHFKLANALLSIGSNLITVTATDLAGNTAHSDEVFARTSPTTANQSALDWNTATLNAITLDASAAPLAARALAITSAAMYDAVNAVSGASSFLYVHIAAPAGASDVAAVAQAAHDALVYLYPGQKAAFNAQLATTLAGVLPGKAKDDGIQVGAQVAAAIIAQRANDGATDYTDYSPGTGPGVWQPTYPMFAPALLPNFATLQPFLMTSDSQFLPAGPPSLDSAQWVSDYNQVKSLGSATSATRTADQTQIARFWADGSGTVTPAGHWNQIAMQMLVAKSGVSLFDTLKLLAQLNVAMGDAAVMVWDAKYADNFWRPITAIQSGGDNAALTSDPSWIPLLNTPNFPEYISGHSGFSAAAATILDNYFGSNVPFTASSPSPGMAGITRSYASFDAAADEAGLSRIYGGIHFNTSVQDGLVAGKALGQYILARFADTSDTTAPAVSLTNKQNPVISGGITLQGLVTDNLSGVASLQGQLDDGTPVNIPFDASGNFAFTPALPAFGTGNGGHVIQLTAIDFSGNVSGSLDFSFTIDTLAPTLAITSPASGDTLTAGAVLAGNVDGTGSAINRFTYAIDGGTQMPLNANGGSFSQALDLSKVGTGSHGLTVSAVDAAGNTVQITQTFVIAAPLALTVATFAPDDGATDVGVTYKPKVTFSRPIDPSTLTTDTFFMTASDVKLPATVVLSDDRTYAWLFPTVPLPSASQIKIVLDGMNVRTADGVYLDGGDGPKSVFTRTFTTVSFAQVPGTSLSGIVADPGPDLTPGTPDDVKSGADLVLMTPDDIFTKPIAGVKVYILGLEDQAVYTGADGSFSFASVPTGDVKLVLDGRTATNPPATYFFPEMVMDLTIAPGKANVVMDAMASGTSAKTTGDKGVYLPRVKTSILQDVGSVNSTTIGVTAESAPNLTPQQQAQLSITVAPGSMIGPDGNKLDSGQVGISTVPAQLVMDMLPPGVLQHTFDITIQAPGITNFSTPATMTFPNVFNAAPGTKLNLLSFDHTTGRLIIDGTGTVSEDGQTVTTDPGEGVTHPGWHGLTPPGSLTGSSDASIAVNDDQSDPEKATVTVKGKLGDIIRVDLSAVKQKDGTIVNNPFSDLRVVGSYSTNFGKILNANGWDATSKLASDDLFYFVPAVAGPTTIHLAGKVTRDGKTKGVELTVNITVAEGLGTSRLGNATDGYSTTGVDSVNPTGVVGLVGANNLVDVYKVQQRLWYLGYPGATGSPLKVTGIMDADTAWAIRLFNAVVNGTSVIIKSTGAFASSATVDQVALNAMNSPHAPHWMELSGGPGWFFGDSQENEDWGTDWAQQVLNAAAAKNTSGSQINVNDISVKKGGITDHATHQAGWNVDVRLVTPTLTATTGFGTWYDLGTAVANLNTNSAIDLWNTVAQESQSDKKKMTATEARDAVAQDANYTFLEFQPDYVGYGWLIDQTVINLYSHIGTGDAFDRAIRKLVPDAASGDDAFDAVVGKRAAYNRDKTMDQIKAFSNLVTDSGATVKNVFFNDPIAHNKLNASGLSFQVTYAETHATHFHVDIKPPSLPSVAPAQSPQAFAPSAVATQQSSAGGFGNDTRLYYRFDKAGTGSVAGRSDAKGSLSVFLAPDTNYLATFYQAATNHWTQYQIHTGPSGTPTDFGTIFLDQFGGTDSDGDGLPDVAEHAIGTDPNKYSTTNDGISDSAKIAQGLDPLAGVAFPTGVIASVPLQGSAQAVVVAGSASNAAKQTAYVATGSYGMAIVDVSQFQKPTVLSQLSLPGGNATGIAVDTAAGIAVVAAGTRLHFVNVANPLSPALIRSLDIAATNVVIANKVIYATVGSTVESFDLITGNPLQTLSLGGGAINGLSRDGNFLYAMDASKNLTVIDIGHPVMVKRGSLTLDNGGGKVFAAGGIAYVPAVDLSNGYSTVNVSDPDHPALASGVDVPPGTGEPGSLVVPNGSGLGVLAGGVLGVPTLDLMDVSDPTDTFAFVTRFTLPEQPVDMAIAGGIAFLADGAAGLQVFNYLPFDNQGQAPQVSIASPAVPAGQSAVNVAENSNITVAVATSDDVQVRSVELLVNGTVVANSLSYPFNFDLAMPTVASGNTTLTVQARATDTGGNISLSAPLTLQVVADTVPPVLEGVNPPDHALRGRALRTVALAFSEPLNPATVTAANFQIIGPGNVVLTPVSIQLGANNALVQLTFGQLDGGDYSVVLHAAAITDVAGNPLGVADVTTTFTVSVGAIQWINPDGGDWNDPANWSTGAVPDAPDDVVINIPGDAVITFSEGTAEVASLYSANALELDGGVLTVNGTFQVDNVLSLNGGTLANAVIQGTLGSINVIYYGSRLHNVTFNSDSTITSDAYYYTDLVVDGGLTVNATLTVQGTLSFEGSQAIAGTGTILLQGGELDGYSFSDGDTTITIDTGVTVRGFGYLYGSGDGTLINKGTIVADSSGDNLLLFGYTIVNLGSLQAIDGGILDFAATVKVADLGTASSSNGGVLVFDGVLDNTGTTTNLQTFFNLWQPGGADNFSDETTISGGTVIGGGITLPDNGLITLDGATLTGEITIPDAGQLSLTGNWTNAGTIHVVGTLTIAGEFTQAAIGTIDFQAGLIDFMGTLDNTGQTLALDGQIAAWTFDNGTIKGGTLTATTAARPAGDFVLDGVTLNADFSAGDGGFVEVDDGITLNGTLNVGNGSVYFGGDQAIAGSGQIVLNGGRLYLDGSLDVGAGITLRGWGDLANDYYYYLGGTLTNRGTISADVSGKTLTFSDTLVNKGTVQAINGGTFEFDGSTTTADLGTLAATGGGTLIFNGALANDGQALDLGAFMDTWQLGNVAITGGTVALAGRTLTPPGNTLYFTDCALTGDMTIDTGTTLTFYGTTSSAGTIHVHGGNLILAGAFTMATIGTIDQVSGTVSFTGALDNTGQTLPLDGTIVGWSIDGGTITGGTLTATTAARPTVTAVKLDGITLNADLMLSGNGYYYNYNYAIFGGITLNATLTLADTVYVDGTVAGTGQIVLAGGMMTDYDSYYVNPAPVGFSIGTGVTVHGSGSINLSTLTNAGTILADDNGQTLSITAASVVNQGTLKAVDGGILSVNGTIKTADLGVFTKASGGILSLTGTVDNANSTLALDQLLAVWQIDDATISNGAVTSATPVTLPTGTNLTLDGATLTGNIIVGPGATLTLTGASTNAGSITVAGGTLNLTGALTQAGIGAVSKTSGTVNIKGTLSGDLALSAATGSWTLAPGGTLQNGTLTAVGGATLILAGGTLDGVTANCDLDLTTGNATAYILNGLTLNGTATLGYYGTLQFNNTQTLTGSGTVRFLSEYGCSIQLTGSNQTLTIDTGITIRGGSNYGSATIGGSYYYDKTNVINKGTILADANGTSITIQPNGGTFQNLGTLQATNGGAIVIGASMKSGDFGNATATTGGTLLYSGTIDNSNASFALDTFLATWNTSYATISGGTVNTTAPYALPDGTSLTLTNASFTGNITLNAGTSLTLNGTWSNTGTITLNGGDLYLDGTFTQASAGTILQNSGTVHVTGTLTGGYNISSPASVWNFGSGTIKGGIISGASGAALTVGVLDGVTINVDLTLLGACTVLDGLTINAVVTAQAGITFGGDQMLAGTGPLLVQNVYIEVDTLTIASGFTLHDAAYIYGTTLINHGSVIADTSGGELSINTYSMTNTGIMKAVGGGLLSIGSAVSAADIESITADAGSTLDFAGTINNAGATFDLTFLSNWQVDSLTINGGTVTTSVPYITDLTGGLSFDNVTFTGDLEISANNELDVTGTFTNLGSIELDDNATLSLDGPISQSQLGNFTNNGGTVYLYGTFTGNLAISGSWSLQYGGVIKGSTITATPGTTLDVSGGKLDGVTINSPLTINGYYMYVVNGLTVNATVTLAAEVYFSNAQTLNVTGELVLQDGYWNCSDLTIAAGITVRGYGSIYYGNMINNGIISADQNGQMLLLDPSTLINHGTLQAINGGKLNISLDIPSVVNDGILLVGAGSSVLTDGNFTNHAGGNVIIQVGSATQFGTLTVDGVATFGGQLTVQLVNAYLPPNAATFKVVTFTSATGTFTVVDGNPADADSFIAGYNAGDLTLTVSSV